MAKGFRSIEIAALPQI